MNFLHRASHEMKPNKCYVLWWSISILFTWILYIYLGYQIYLWLCYCTVHVFVSHKKVVFKNVSVFYFNLPIMFKILYPRCYLETRQIFWIFFNKKMFRIYFVQESFHHLLQEQEGSGLKALKPLPAQIKKPLLWILDGMHVEKPQPLNT